MREWIDRALVSVDMPVLVLSALLLLGGTAFAGASAPPDRTARAFGGMVKVTLPAGWTGSRRGDIYVVRQPRLDGYAPSIVIRKLQPPGGDPDPMWVDLALAQMDRETQESGIGYRVLSTEERLAFGNHPATFTYYAIVRDPPGTLPGAAVLPAIVGGIDVLVITNGRRAWRISASAPADEMGDRDSPIRRTLESVRLSP